MKSSTKKKTALALSLIMTACLTACSGSDNSSNNEDTKEQISDETIEEGVIVTYKIVDKTPSDMDIEETIDIISDRISEYTRHSECVVNDDEISFGIELDPEEYDVNDLVYELGRSCELYILDEENYTLWSQGEEFEAALTGEDVKDAYAIEDVSTDDNFYGVAVSFTDKGTEKFSEFTNANIDNTTYIVFDGELIMSPQVFDSVTDGQLLITGLDSYEDARDIQESLTTAALPLNLELVDYEIVESEE